MHCCVRLGKICYSNSSENKELLNEFLVKYEDEAQKYKSREDVGIADVSVEEIEISTLQLNTNRVGDGNSLSVEHVLFLYPIIYKHLCALF